MMIEGGIDSVSHTGQVLGWVRDVHQPAPCVVEIQRQGVTLASACADQFRPDLLRSGHGHGHYGFAAQLRSTLPPGPCALTLHLPHLGVSAAMAATIPPLRLPGPATVETLLAEPPVWTGDDVLAAPACLDMAGYYAALGAPRFLDAVMQFALQRFPYAAEATLYLRDLQAGLLSPQELLLLLLRSRERADLAPALISPHSPAFPFTSPPLEVVL